ncbi:hypothetical protein KBA63_03605 [Candidatus Woesebacteria bacterium]|nr:hypothetical protein [Candidatus Woesebacteria bacterium]
METFMKRAVIITLFLFGMLSLSAKTTFAQASRCQGNETSGCIVCVYSDGTGMCESQNAPDGTFASSCAPGYKAPSTDLFTYCRQQSCPNPLFIPCQPIQTRNNCVTDSSGSKSCQICDDIPNNSVADCDQTATSQADCRTNCIAPATSNPQACTNFQGACKATCATDETPISGSCSVGTNKCCLPNSLLGSSGTGTKQSTKAATCDAAGGGQGIPTAVGCVPIENVTALTAFVMRWLLGIGGGIAFIMILAAGFQILTSSGDPKRLSTGQELLTSAVSGLILIIFSIFILRLIGVNILGLF